MTPASNDHLPEGLREIAERYRLAQIYAFGSRAREVAARLQADSAPPAQPGSDIDIGVYPEEGVTLGPAQRVDVTIELEDLLGATRVDLVLLPEASAFLALDVIRGELLYCNDLDAQAEYELYVLRRAGDLAPFERERRRLILSRHAP